MYKIFSLIFFLLNSTFVWSQLVKKNGSDFIDSTFFLNYDAYKIKSQNDFKIGTKAKRKLGESKEQFLIRIFPTTKFSHGPFEFGNWKNKFGKHIITFQEAPFVRQFRKNNSSKTNFITGLLLVPMDSNRNYQIVKICELSSEGGEVGIESVFFANADEDKQTIELAVITSERFERHGIGYYTHFYKNFILNNKLQVIGHIYEKCFYTEVFENGSWDFYMGQNGLPTRDIDCTLETAEKIKIQLKKNGY